MGEILPSKIPSRIIPLRSFLWLIVDYFVQDDFLGSVSDGIHPAYPFKLIGYFQFFGHAFGLLQLLDDQTAL
jgi:hypothetical protein